MLVPIVGWIILIELTPARMHALWALHFADFARERLFVAPRFDLDRDVVFLARSLAVTSSFCATRPAGHGSFGIAVLSAFPIVHQQQYDLSYQAHREPRYCLRSILKSTAVLSFTSSTAIWG